MTGARFTGGGVTRIVNAGSGTATWPSLTEIVTFENVPVLAGVPCNRPVAASNAAQLGRLRIENVSGWPSASLAVGVNVYASLTTIDVAGVPEIVGARFVGLGGAMTVTSNAGSVDCALPSDTQTTTPRCMPTS